MFGWLRTRRRRHGALMLAASLIGYPASSQHPAQLRDVQAAWPAATHHRFVTVNGRRIFFREAGERGKPVLLLLHGYPASSHTYRNLIPLLSGRFHVIAPDHLGSGYSDKPDPAETRYTFDLLADHVRGLLDALGVDAYTIYMQDFGAPVGFRLMLKAPDRVQAVISQNGNAYLEGISPDRLAFFRRAGEDRSEENLTALFAFTSSAAVRDRQYLRDVKGRESIMSPDTWTMDGHHLEGERERRIQVQLFQDYRSNLEAYPAWQAFLRKRRPPTLMVWGANDPVFVPAGARAFLRDVPDARLILLDAGHFAVEEKAVDIAKAVTTFMIENEARLRSSKNDGGLSPGVVR